MLSRLRRLRDFPGVLIKDLPRYRRAFRHSGAGFRSHPEGWISLANRGEYLSEQAGLPGFACTWPDGTTLHAPLVLPALGKSLFARALSEWPIEFRDTPRVTTTRPAISFVFAHAGRDRLEQLHAVIRSINGQEEVACECVVVDQSESSIRDALPAHVKSCWLDKSALTPGWRKSWAFNVGARMATADILVFQDGDVVVPRRYALELMRAFENQRFGAASLQRFLFYLDERSSRSFHCTDATPSSAAIEQIRHNWKGGTIAVRKSAFFDIGGFDEGFVDWGGEDDEFYDRCETVGHVRAGYVPFVHLWHAPQRERKTAQNVNTASVMPARMKIDRQARVRELVQRCFGAIEAPHPSEGYSRSRRLST